MRGTGATVGPDTDMKQKQSVVHKGDGALCCQAGADAPAAGCFQRCYVAHVGCSCMQLLTVVLLLLLRMLKAHMCSMCAALHGLVLFVCSMFVCSRFVCRLVVCRRQVTARLPMKLGA
jgi:hypothetical protein